MTSHERHISNHRRPLCLFSNSFRLTTKETPKLQITLWGESVGDQGFPAQSAGNAETVLCHDVIIFQVISGPLTGRAWMLILDCMISSRSLISRTPGCWVMYNVTELIPWKKSATRNSLSAQNKKLILSNIRKNHDSVEWKCHLVYKFSVNGWRLSCS